MSEELERASETEAGAKVTDSSGNVFADLDLAHGEEDMLKIHIALAITNTLRKRGLTQAEAAKLIGADQSKVSLILRGRLKGLSADRLIRYLVKLGRDVDVHISRRYADRPGRIRVRMSA
jgi:predicted XRE-type DNA-binding protein